MLLLLAITRVHRTQLLLWLLPGIYYVCASCAAAAAVAAAVLSRDHQQSQSVVCTRGVRQSWHGGVKKGSLLLRVLIMAVCACARVCMGEVLCTVCMYSVCIAVLVGAGSPGTYAQGVRVQGCGRAHTHVLSQGQAYRCSNVLERRA